MGGDQQRHPSEGGGRRLNGHPAVVVGAGAIGAQLDEPDTREPLTHAGGILAAGLALAAFVDTHPPPAPWRPHGAARPMAISTR